MKKLISLILALTMLLSLAACGAANEDTAPETVEFTDDAGRTVTLPAQIDRIAPSGSIATMILTGSMKNLTAQQDTIQRMEDRYAAEGMIQQVLQFFKMVRLRLLNLRAN